MILRLFKRFFYATIERKYGYLKFNAPDKIEISGRIFCSELELNPKVLRLGGVITTFSSDAMLSWLTFLKLIGIFVLRKDLLQMRLEFILKFLHLTDPSELEEGDYIQERMQIFKFKNRSLVPASQEILNLWNKIRVEISKHTDDLFSGVPGTTVHMERSIKVLQESGLQAHQTLAFFNMIFELS